MSSLLGNFAGWATDDEERNLGMRCVAAPIAFSDDGLLSQWTRSASFDVDSLVDYLR